MVSEEKIQEIYSSLMERIASLCDEAKAQLHAINQGDDEK